MEIIAGTEKVERQVGRWCPSDVAFIRGISFENCVDNSFDLALRLSLQPRPEMYGGWPEMKGEFWDIDIVFHQVRDLTLTICGPWDIPTPGFSIENIRDRQWEGINLLVFDFEGLSKEEIRFGAKSAAIRDCRPMTTPPRSPGVWLTYPGEFRET